MKDEYKTFNELRAKEAAKAWEVVLTNGKSETLVIAPHGGGIEPGTSEISKALAGNDLSLYVFEGNKKSGNASLHITSTRFDEPQALSLLAKSRRTVAIHGCAGEEEIVYVGGRDGELAKTIVDGLKASGFQAEIAQLASLKGTERRNICNRNKVCMGVQLEITEGLRSTMFKGLNRVGRKRKREMFWSFVGAVRKVLLDSESASVPG